MNQAWTWEAWQSELAARSRRGLVVLLFTAPGCQPCGPVKVALKRLFDQGMIWFYIADAERSPELVEVYNVGTVPTVVSFVNGAVVDYCRGPETKNIAERVMTFIPSRKEAQST
jgi:thioredoxin-like negative regulator of GroEL